MYFNQEWNCSNAIVQQDVTTSYGIADLKQIERISFDDLMRSESQEVIPKKFDYKAIVDYIRFNSKITYEIECEDLIILFVKEGLEDVVYILSKIKNDKYFHKLVEVITDSVNDNWNGKIVRISNIFIINNNFINLEKINKIAKFWWFLELNSYDFILTTQGIFFIGIDKILPKITFCGKEIFFKTTSGGEVIQDVLNGINNKQKLFWNNITRSHIPVSQILGIEELKKKALEVKIHEEI